MGAGDIAHATEAIKALIEHTFTNRVFYFGNYPDDFMHSEVLEAGSNVIEALQAWMDRIMYLLYISRSLKNDSYEVRCICAACCATRRTWMKPSCHQQKEADPVRLVHFIYIGTLKYGVDIFIN